MTQDLVGKSYCSLWPKRKVTDLAAEADLARSRHSKDKPLIKTHKYEEIIPKATCVVSSMKQIAAIQGNEGSQSNAKKNIVDSN